MRTLVFVAYLFFSVGFLEAQEPQPHPHSNAGLTCADAAKGLPMFYYQAVLDRYRPPDWSESLNSITVGMERKIVLWTDGKKFLLWTDTPVIPKKNKNIVDFLLELDEECRLPPDPRDAADLIKVDWESKELTEAQYTQLHRDFSDALAKYVSKIQVRYPEMMATRVKILQHLHRPLYSIVYDNSYEHIEVQAWDDPKDDLVKWVYGLHRLAEDSFHRSFGATPSK
jgi:hypothetical protein